MTRLDFFVRLREGLQKLPPEEMENAVRYYTEYFDDAGPDEEQRVLHELGDPLKIAQQITAEYMVRDIVTEPVRTQERVPKAPRKGLTAVWIAILAVFASPIALPIAIAIAAVALAMVIVAAALVFSFFAVSLALIVAGVFAFFIGCVTLAVHLPTGLCAIGCGILLAGIGLLLFLPCLWVTRAIFGGIARFISQKIMKRGIAK